MPSNKRGVPWWTSCRLMLSLVGLFAFFNAYSQRVGMSVAILCMINQTALHELRQVNNGLVHPLLSNAVTERPLLISNSTNLTLTYIEPEDDNVADSETCSLQIDVNSTSQVEYGNFVWEKELQGHILGSFFYGYVISQIPGGMLAERYGGKWVFFGSALLSLIATVLTPIGARASPYFLIALRVICGIGSGALFPVMHVIISRWAPPTERSIISGIAYSGAWMGNVISLPIAGLLCQYGFDNGWGSIFYCTSMSSVLSLVLWVFCVFSTPAEHPRISEAERKFIETSLGGQLQEHNANKKKATPWLRILISPVVWAPVAVNITSDWGLYTFLTNIPTYMYEVLKFDIAKNGALSALPFVGCWIMMVSAPLVADKLIASKKLSIGWTRKLMNSIGSFGAAAFMVGLAFVSCSQTVLAVFILTCGVAITGCVYSGFMVNYMDIAPRYAGSLLGLGNCLAALTGFVAPYTAAVITKNQTPEEWQIVFFIAAAIYASGGLIFLLLSSGEVQKWARDEDTIYNDDSAAKPLKTLPTDQESHAVI